MTEQKPKRKSIGEHFTYAYLRHIKKWMFCPNCESGKMALNKKESKWQCESCGYELSADEFEDDYVFCREGGEAQVVGDEEHRRPLFCAAAQRFYYLAARRGVLHRGRLVAEQELRPEHEGAR